MKVLGQSTYVAVVVVAVVAFVSVDFVVSATVGAAFIFGAVVECLVIS